MPAAMRISPKFLRTRLVSFGNIFGKDFSSGFIDGDLARYKEHGTDFDSLARAE